jgi:hypothetical protein
MDASGMRARDTVYFQETIDNSGNQSCKPTLAVIET